MTAQVPRFNQRVLTVFLLVSLPGLLVGMALVFAFGNARLSESYGRHLEEVAEQAAAGVDAYVYRRILDVSLLARTPDVRREAAAASARPFDKAAAIETDREWAARAAQPAGAVELLGSSASRFMADLVAHDRIYREMLLTDRNGRLVAASAQPSDYFQGDEDWWTAAFDDGRHGRVSVSDLRWDQSAGVHALEISVPVQAPDSEALVGILKVVADSREMLALIGNLQLGQTGSAWLLRRNGSIVFGRHTTDPNARFYAGDLVTTRVDAMRQSGPIGGTSFEARAPDGSDQIVGLADSQLGASFPALAWVVAVSQGRDELLAPVSTVGWYLITLFALSALVIVGLALWFSVRLAAPQVDIDMHLVDHPRVSRVGEADSEEVESRRQEVLRN